MPQAATGLRESACQSTVEVRRGFRRSEESSVFSDRACAGASPRYCPLRRWLVMALVSVRISRRVLTAVAGTLVSFSLAACDGTGSTSPGPVGAPGGGGRVPGPGTTPTSPTITTQTKVPGGVTTTPQAPKADPYQLTTAQAIALLGAGTAVAGALPGGSEGLALKTTETTYESKQVRKEVCAQEYDYTQKKDVYKCRDKYVTETVPVTKPAFQVSVGVPRRTFTTALAAINNIAGAGATKWRRM